MPTKECFKDLCYRPHRSNDRRALVRRSLILTKNKKKAATLFIKGDVPDTAFNTLVRAAKHVEKEKPDAAVQFYQKEN